MKKIFKYSILSLLLGLGLTMSACNEETKMPTEVPTGDVITEENPSINENPVTGENNPATGDVSDVPTDENTNNGGFNPDDVASSDEYKLQAFQNSISFALDPEKVYKLTTSNDSAIDTTYFNFGRCYTIKADGTTEAKADLNIQNFFMEYLEQNFRVSNAEYTRTIATATVLNGTEYTIEYSLNSDSLKQNLTYTANPLLNSYVLTDNGTKTSILIEDISLSTTDFDTNFNLYYVEDEPNIGENPSDPVETVNIFKTNLGAYQGYIDYDSTELSGIEGMYFDDVILERGLDLKVMADSVVGELSQTSAESVTLLIYMDTNKTLDTKDLFLEFSGFDGEVTIIDATNEIQTSFSVRCAETMSINLNQNNLTSLGMFSITIDYVENQDSWFLNSYYVKSSTEDTSEPTSIFGSVDESLKITSAPSIFAQNDEQYWVFFYVDDCSDCETSSQTILNYIEREKNQFDYPLYLVDVFYPTMGEIIDDEEENLLNVSTARKLNITDVPTLVLIENGTITKAFKNDFESILALKTQTKETNDSVEINTEGNVNINFDSTNFRITDVYGILLCADVYYDTTLTATQTINVNTELVELSLEYDLETTTFTTDGKLGITSKNTSPTAPFIETYASASAYGEYISDYNFLKSISLTIGGQKISLADVTPEMTVDYWYSSRADFKYGQSSGTMSENSYTPDGVYVIKDLKIDSNLSRFATYIKYETQNLTLEIESYHSETDQSYITFNLTYDDGTYEISLKGEEELSINDNDSATFYVIPSQNKSTVTAEYAFKKED